MNRFILLILPLAVACGVLAVVLVASSDWLAPLGLDFWNIPKWQGDLKESGLRDDRIQKHERLMHRLEAKEALTTELVKGRISLKEALFHFRALNNEDSNAVETMRRTIPAATEEEATCRQVLLWASVHLETFEAEQAREVWARLEEESRDLLPD